MNKRLVSSIVAILALTLALSAILASCVDRPEETETTLDGEWSGKENFEPSTGIGKNTEELASRNAEYEENASNAFKHASASSESNFAVSDYEDGVKIDGYIGNEEIIVVPESIGGKTVKAIGESVFLTTVIRAVYVPDSVTYIEKGAFYNNTDKDDKLVTLRLPFIGDGKENTN